MITEDMIDAYLQAERNAEHVVPDVDGRTVRRHRVAVGLQAVFDHIVLEAVTSEQTKR
jgi:hypothetical protein